MLLMSWRAMTGKERRRRQSCREEESKTFQGLKLEPKCKNPTKVQWWTSHSILARQDFSPLWLVEVWTILWWLKSLPRSLAFSSQVKKRFGCFYRRSVLIAFYNQLWRDTRRRVGELVIRCQWNFVRRVSTNYQLGLCAELKHKQWLNIKQNWICVFFTPRIWHNNPTHVLLLEVKTNHPT